MKLSSNGTYVAIVVAVCAGVWLSASRAETGANGLSDAAKQAIAELFPGGRIEKVETERRIVQLYEISVVVDGKKREVSITTDGTVLEMEEAIDSGVAPDAVKEVIQKLAGDAKLSEFERIEVRAELGAVRLQQPRIEYEAEFGAKDKQQMIRLSEEGKAVADEDDRGHHDDEED